ncbi:MAG: BspA family leucine-rich repeat surface protein, partial [Allomuricauda sp.]
EDPAPPKNNAPVIAAKTFSVPENIAAGTAIGTVTATDADKDALTFSIKTNDNNLFAITKAGVLSLASGQSLDFATKAQHVITVAVSDGEASASAKVTINVTKVDPENLAPEIAAQQFTVSESIDDTFEIGVVQATDPDQDDLLFSIVTNDNDLFEITEAGSLSLAAGQSLDFGTAQEHTITVAVSDGNSSVNAEITIKVTQAEPTNEAPVVEAQEFSVKENIDDVFEIGVVEATDPEEDVLAFSISENDNDLFEITDKGVLSLAEGMQLNYDAQQQHIIKVTVSDGTNTVETTVTINVEELTLADDPTSFVTTWKTTMDGESITIGTDVNQTYDYIIDWGDGTVQQLSDFNPTHQYATAGIHTIAIQSTFPAIRMYQNADAPKLMSIEQWGNIFWKSMERAFQGCENMEYNAADVPNLASVTNMSLMFGSCSKFDGDISGWNVSTITHMNGLFNASSFNGDIGDWDVSNVTNMASMFQSNEVFNQDISAWDVSSVTLMGSMFYNAKAFNQDIGGWDTSNVTNMSLMFASADSFNQDISGWDVSNVTKMNSMFRGALAFNQDISGWDVSNVTEMNNMFKSASAFDQDLGNWLVQNVTDMNEMFDDSGISAQNYGNSLVGWVSKAVAFNVTLGALNVNYCAGSQGEAAREFLINSKGWLISGDAPIACP